MRVLCDQHVPPRYVNALRGTSDLTVERVRDALELGATDRKIAQYAATHEMAVLTSDDDFFEIEETFGLLYYEQPENPEPRAVADAVRRIGEVYDSETSVETYVPDGWV